MPSLVATKTLPLPCRAPSSFHAIVLPLALARPRPHHFTKLHRHLSRKMRHLAITYHRSPVHCLLASMPLRANTATTPPPHRATNARPLHHLTTPLTMATVTARSPTPAIYC
jgi:type II secretory pathway component PulL